MTSETNRSTKEMCKNCGLCIAAIGLFSDLTEDEQRQLMRRADHERFSAGNVLFRPGGPVDRIFIVKEGKVKLVDYTEDGKEYIYDIITSGGTWMEENLFSGLKHIRYAICLTPSHICTLRKSEVEELFLENPRFAVRFINHLGKRLFDAGELNRLLFINDAKERLEQFLIHRCRILGHPVIELSRQTMASAINLSRETVSKKLQELAEEGKIELIGYKKIHVVENRVGLPVRGKQIM